MGAALDKPITDKTTERGESTSSAGLQYGASAMQGWRVDMEDEHTCVEDFPGLPGHAFFAVYDGHGGAKTAALAHHGMLDALRKQPAFVKYSNTVKQGGGGRGREDVALVSEALQAAFIMLDAELRPKLASMCASRNARSSAAISLMAAVLGVVVGVVFIVVVVVVAMAKAGPPTPDAPKRRLDRHDHLDRRDSSGTTAVACLLTPTHLICANAGDSRACYCSGGALRDGAVVGGRVIALSEDHKPCSVGERARIERAGGRVAQGAMGLGPMRVDGALAVRSVSCE